MIQLQVESQVQVPQFLRDLVANRAATILFRESSTLEHHRPSMTVFLGGKLVQNLSIEIHTEVITRNDIMQHLPMLKELGKREKQPY